MGTASTYRCLSKTSGSSYSFFCSIALFLPILQCEVSRDGNIVYIICDLSLKSADIARSNIICATLSHLHSQKATEASIQLLWLWLSCRSQLVVWPSHTNLSCFFFHVICMFFLLRDSHSRWCRQIPVVVVELVVVLVMLEVVVLVFVAVDEVPRRISSRHVIDCVTWHGHDGQLVGHVRWGKLQVFLKDFKLSSCDPFWRYKVQEAGSSGDSRGSASHRRARDGGNLCEAYLADFMVSHQLSYL